MSDSTRRRVGHIERKPNGRYLARIQSGVKADGSPRIVSKMHDTEQEADAWLVAKSIELGKRPDLAAGITVASLWAMYQRDRLPQLAKSTQVGYVYQMEHNILPTLGERDAASVTHGDIQRMLLDMRPSVARLAKATLSAVLTHAVRRDVLGENVMRKAPFVMPEHSRFAEPNADVWDDDPFAAIEEARDVWDVRTAVECMRRIEGLALEPIFLACVGAGLRVEEAFALRPMDVRRIVGSFDEYGREIWVTQLAVHHATTREERRKATKTVNGSGIVPMLEPFGERYWEVVQQCDDRRAPVCKLSASRQNKTWRAYFAKPPETWHKRMGDDRKVKGRLYGLPYIPLSRMRATHTTLMQEAGVLDSVNQSMHRNTGAVQQRHYMRPDLTQTAIEVSRRIS